MKQMVSECLCINPITQINLERNQSSKIFLTKGQLWLKDFVENFLKHKGTLGVTNVNNDFRMSSFMLLRLVSATVFLVIVYGCECIVWFYHETLSMLKRMYSLVAKFHYDFKYFAEDVALDLLFVGIVIDSLALRICCGKNWLLSKHFLQAVTVGITKHLYLMFKLLEVFESLIMNDVKRDCWVLWNTAFWRIVKCKPLNEFQAYKIMKYWK